MIRAYSSTATGLVEHEGEGALAAALWVDLVDPGDGERAAAERALGFALPTRADMEEIELSSRLYVTDDAIFLTALLLAGVSRIDSGDRPKTGPVTFVLTGTQLVTLRYHTPRPFETFPVHAGRSGRRSENAEMVLLGLLDEIVDRQADILETLSARTDDLSRQIFHAAKGDRPQGAGYTAMLAEIGRTGELVSSLRLSLLSMERLTAFLGDCFAEGKAEKRGRGIVKTLLRDINSILEHSDFLSQKVTFLLDATLGMINNQQSGIIKIFSVVAVIFLPPTLIASIYGMNFALMPELSWSFGYPLALVAMVVSAILPYLFFKFKGWL